MSAPRPVLVRVAQGSERRQVVVKFRSSETVRETLRTGLAAAATAPGRNVRAAAPVRQLLQAPGLVAAEPLFPEERTERSMVGRGFLVSLPEPAVSDAASFNVFSFDRSADAAKAAAKWDKDRLVEFAHVIEPRYLYARARRKMRPRSPTRGRRRRTTSGVDPLLNRQWGLTAVQLAQAQNLAGFQQAANIKIGVIDSGVDASHPDLQGIFVDEQNFTPGVLKDTAGHGTHVAGIIAAVSNNTVGISGVCQSTKLYSLKALNPYDGPGYYRAIRYAITHGLQVLNFSLGGSHDPTEELLIKQAIDAGIVVVAAMGNDKLDGNPTSYPAAIERVVAVGATDEVDKRADFSQTGRHIHLVAPGVNILSTVPTYPSSLATVCDYEAWPGTSMATPFVTAAVALMLAKKPTATVAQIRRALQRGVNRVDGQTGFNNDYGYGRLNIPKCLAAI
jgi:subtilisin family serine protease